MNNKPKKLSKNLSFNEGVYSATAQKYGMGNKPSCCAIRNMIMAAESLFQPLREWHGQPIKVTSMYRSAALNKRLGSSSRSQHRFGEDTGLIEGAIDLDMDFFNNGMTNAEAYHWLRGNVEYDQLIWEYGNDDNPDWVHVSFRYAANRKQSLRTMRDEAGRFILEPFLL